MLVISRTIFSGSTTHVCPIDAHTSIAQPSNQGMVAAELKASKSIKSLEAAIPKAEAYGIDTAAAEELLKELLKVRKACGCFIKYRP